MANTPELVPCPFCRGPAGMETSFYKQGMFEYDYRYPKCLVCDANMDHKGHVPEEMIIQAWNTRGEEIMEVCTYCDHNTADQAPDYQKEEGQ